MVTNPATRDWTVTASVYATLNEMYGNRTVCGIGRGDSAVRVTNGAPTTLATLREAIHVIRELANGRSVEYKGTRAAPAVGEPQPSSRCGSRRTARRRWSSPARSATGSSSSSPTCRSPSGRSARCARRPPTPGAIRTSITICVAAPAYVTDGTDAGLAHGREQCRWFGGMVGNHVADIVARYGDDAAPCPRRSPTTSRVAQGYDYNEHGQAGNTHTQFVPDEIVDRFCIVGPPEVHIERMEELKALGVDQFAIYLQHDDKDHTLAVYGEKVMPAVAEARAGEVVTSRSRRRSPIRSTRRRRGRAHPSGSPSRCAPCHVPVSFALVAAAVGGLQGGRPGERRRVLGCKLLPRTDDRAMPHVWDMFTRARRARERAGHADTSPASSPGRRGTRSVSPSPRSCSASIIGVVLAVFMSRFKVVERALDAVPGDLARRCRSSASPR